MHSEVNAPLQNGIHWFCKLFNFFIDVDIFPKKSEMSYNNNLKYIQKF